jgi:hypothetical protein
MQVLLVLFALVLSFQVVVSTLIFQDQFTVSDYDPTNIESPYSYFFFDYTTTNISNNVRQGSLYQTVNPYTNTVPQMSVGSLDHVKVLQYCTDPFVPGRKGISKYTARVSVTHYGIDNHPFPADMITNTQDDIRLAACGMNTADFTTMMVADFLLTNEGIYAIYERLPFARTPSDLYGAFTQAKRVGDRQPSDTHQLSIEYNKKIRTLSYYVEDERVLYITLIGFKSSDPGVVTLCDHGGQETLAEPASFSYGFGCFTLLDMNDYHNPTGEGLVKLGDGEQTEYINPTGFWDEGSDPANRLFGQGSVLLVDSVKADGF